MTIREATKEDLHDMIDMVKSMREELNAPYREAEVVNLCVSSLKLAPCFLYIKDGKVIAMAGLYVHFCAFSGQATLSDYGFYVRPRHRAYSLYSALNDKCKEYSEEVNLPLRLNFAAPKNIKFAEGLAKRKGLEIITVIGEHNGRR